MIYRYLNINELNIDEISERVSFERLKKTEKFKHESDKKRSIAVEYLLNELIDEYCNTYSKDMDLKISTPVSLTYDEKGKPHIYVNGQDAIHFSLSHSGDYVACIVSESICGIDIEKHSDRPYEKILRRVCTESESGFITNVNEFYNLWTLKEGVLKATGRGMSLDMRSFAFDKEGDGSFSTEVEGIAYRGQVVKAPDGYSLSYVTI